MIPKTFETENYSEFKKITDFPRALLNKAIHDRESFDCGEPALNQYIKQYARQDMEKNLSRTIVFYEPNEDKPLKSIVAFFTIISKETYVDLGEENINGKQVTSFYKAITIGRLAVDIKYQKKGLGKDLLETVLGWIAQELKEKKPNERFIVIVDAKDGAIEFYKKFGFIQMKEDDVNLLYYPFDNTDIE
nr:GNAT family N-acetyltransferase [uncultured Neisseria sp.]